MTERRGIARWKRITSGLGRSGRRLSPGDRGELMVRHRIPFTTFDLSGAERLYSYGTGPIEYSHRLVGGDGPSVPWQRLGQA
jgi:hypothetical protein